MPGPAAEPQGPAHFDLRAAGSLCQVNIAGATNYLHRISSFRHVHGGAAGTVVIFSVRGAKPLSIGQHLHAPESPFAPGVAADPVRRRFGTGIGHVSKKLG